MSSKSKIIFFVSLAIKLIFAAFIVWRFGFDAHFTDNDVSKFLTAGVNLFRHGVFSMSSSAPFAPTMFIPPVYSLFLAANFFIFSKFWVLATYILQGLLMSWAAVYLYRNLEGNISGKSAFWCAILFAAEPFSNFITNVITPDSIFAVFLLVGVISFWNFLKGQSLAQLIVSSIFIALATLVKPISQFLPIVFLVVLILFLWKKKVAAKTRLKHALFYILIFLAILSPWLIRNKLSFNSFSITSLPAYNIYFYNAAAVIAKENKINIGEAQELLFKKAQNDTGAKKYEDFFDPRYSKYLRSEAFKILLSHKLEYLKIHLLTLGPFFVNDSYGKIYPLLGLKFHNEESITLLFSNGNFAKIVGYVFGRGFGNLLLFAIGKAVWLAVYILIFCHLCKLWKEKDRVRLLNFGFFSLAVLYFALLTGPVAAASYRMPIQAFIFALIFI